MAVEDVLNSVGSGSVNVILIIFAGLIIISICLGLFFWMRHLRRFREFKVVVWEVMKGGGISESYDKAGIFVSGKTGNKLFFLKNGGVGLKPDNVAYHFNKGGDKVVYLMRYGYRNYVFISPTIKDSVPIFKVGEEDVNWAINSYEANKKRFSQSLLMQLLPFMILALICILILVMMIYLFKQFSVFKDVASSIAQASQVFAHNNAVNMSMMNNGIITSGGVI